MSKYLRPFLALIHIIYSIYLFIKSQWAFINRELTELLHPRSLMIEENILSECDTSRIKKLPGHLIVVVGSENISFIDLARIISWTVALGVPHVSFYDQDGIIKENSSICKGEFEKLRPDAVSRVVWDFEKFSKIISNGTSNGFKSTTKVHFLSYKDGKGEIIGLTKELAQAVTTGILKINEIDMNLLNEKLSQNFPEPDLVIVSGKTFATFGVLPWHIRITEFFHIPTHHNLPPEKFIEILEKYGVCEQRYGK